MIPTLLSWTGSAVIHDIKGENWDLTSGWRALFSTCIRFDPTDPSSPRYNPLLDVRRGEREVRDVQNIADILVDPEGSLERRNHWEKTGHALLVGTILHVLYAETDKTLSGCARFLSDPKRSFEATLTAMMSTRPQGTFCASSCRTDGQVTAEQIGERALGCLVDSAEFSGSLSGSGRRDCHGCK